MPNGTEERSGREIRLLLLVVAVALATLLVLARFRFPAAEITTVVPAPAPLQQLSAHASYDDLTTAVADASARILPSFVTVELGPVRAARRGSSARTPVGPRRYLPALRRGPGAIVYVPWSDAEYVSIAGQPAAACEPAGRPDHHLALVCASGHPGLPSAPGDSVFAAAVSNYTGSTYALVVEAGSGGPSIRPVFMPRVDPLGSDLELPYGNSRSDPMAWSTAPLRIAGAPALADGAFLFAIDGRLIGLTMREEMKAARGVTPLEPGLIIVPAAALARVVEAAGQQ